MSGACSDQDQPDNQRDDRSQLDVIADALRDINWPEVATNLDLLLPRYPAAELEYLAAHASWFSGDVNCALQHAKAAVMLLRLTIAPRPPRTSELISALVLLGHLHSEAAILSPTKPGWEDHLREAIKYFKQAHELQPADAAIAFRLAFLHHRLGDIYAAWSAANECYKICCKGPRNLQGVPLAPQYLIIQWLIKALDQALYPDEQVRLTNLHHDEHLVAFYREHALQWMTQDILAKGPLQWQTHEMLIALPAVADSEDNALMMQAVGGRCLTAPAHWIPSAHALIDPALCNPNHQGEQGPREESDPNFRLKAFTAEREMVKGNLASESSTGAKRPMHVRTAERHLLETAFCIQPGRHFHLRRPLASALRQDLGWPPSKSKLSCPSLASLALELRHDEDAWKIEHYLVGHKGLPIERILAAMLMPEYVKVHGSIGQGNCQLLLKAPNGLQRTIAYPPMTQHLRQVTAQLIVQFVTKPQCRPDMSKQSSGMDAEEKSGLCTALQILSGPFPEGGTHQGICQPTSPLQPPQGVPATICIEMQMAVRLIGTSAANMMQAKFASLRRCRQGGRHCPGEYGHPPSASMLGSCLPSTKTGKAEAGYSTCGHAEAGPASIRWGVRGQSTRWEAAIRMTTTIMPCIGDVRRPCKLRRQPQLVRLMNLTIYTSCILPVSSNFFSKKPVWRLISHDSAGYHVKLANGMGTECTCGLH